MSDDARLLSAEEIAAIVKAVTPGAPEPTEADWAIGTGVADRAGSVSLALLAHIDAQAERIRELTARVAMFEMLILSAAEQQEVIPATVLLVGNRKPTAEEIAYGLRLEAERSKAEPEAAS